MRGLWATVTVCVLVAAAAGAAIDHGTSGVANTGMVQRILQLTGPHASGMHDSVQCWGSQPWTADGSRIYFTHEDGSSEKQICWTTPAGATPVCLGNDVVIDQVTYEDVCMSHPNVVTAGPQAGRIVFQLNDPVTGDAMIWIMDADGGNRENLTAQHELPGCSETCLPGESKPQVSPDGTRIAFRAYGVLYVMAMDGSGTGGATEPPLLVSGSLLGASHHRWGDAATLYFMSGDESCDVSGAEIYRVTVPATLTGASAPVPERLTTYDDDNCSNWPSPSPDGTRVAYHRSDFTIHVMNSNGSNDVAVVASADACGPTSWSPNGEWLAYKYQPDTSTRRIAVVGVAGAGTGQRYDLTTGFADFRHWFSPAGTGILFKDHRRSSTQWTTRDDNANGGDVLFLQFTPTWAPAFGADEAVVEPIPALTPAGLAALAGLLGAVAAIALRRRLG